jgi:hypothetical protein
MANGDVVTNDGLGIIANRLKAHASIPIPEFIGWGTGTTTPAVTDVALAIAATDEARTNGTNTQQTSASPAITDDTFQVAGTITCITAGKAITEVGLFTAASGPEMLVRSVFDVINVDVNDSITFTLNVRIANA